MQETNRPATDLEEGRTAPGPDVASDRLDSVDTLRPVTTDAPLIDIRRRLTEANRRGRLPELTWRESRFHLTLPTRPLLTRLVGQIDQSRGRQTIRFRIETLRGMYHGLIWLTVLSGAIGPWVTELLSPWPLFSWYWYPPLCLIMAIWVALHWPRMSRRDAQRLAPSRIDMIRSRLESAPSEDVDVASGAS